MSELTPISRPVREQTNPPYYDWRQTSHMADEFPGLDQLASAVRRELSAAKADGRLPKKLRTLVSLNRTYGARLAVRIRGLRAADVFAEEPAAGETIRMASGVGAGDDVPTEWRLNRDWAFVFLQVYLLADAYNVMSSGAGDDFVNARYHSSLYVQDVGSMTYGHLVSIVDGLDRVSE